MAITSPVCGLWGSKLYYDNRHPMCEQAATNGEALVLLLDDTQMTDNAFLADINSIIMTGAIKRWKPCGCVDEGCSYCQALTWMGSCQKLNEAEKVSIE